jgi:hypothetical protein
MAEGVIKLVSDQPLREIVNETYPVGRIGAGKKSEKRHSALHTTRISVSRIA